MIFQVPAGALSEEVSAFASRDDQHQFSGRNVTERRNREKLASEVFQRLYSADASASKKQLRELVEWCQRQIAIIFDNPERLPERSSTSETHNGQSDEVMPWDKPFSKSKRAVSRSVYSKSQHASLTYEDDEF